MKLSDTIPFLDAVASIHGTTLEEVATRPAHQDAPQTLSSCCWQVRRSIVDDAAPVESMASLTTIDALLGQFDEAALPRGPFWRRLLSARESGFVDLVVEAAMALFQRTQCRAIELERPIPTQAGLRPKNVDLFLIDRNGNEWWMDLVAIQRSSHQPSKTMHTAEQVSELFQRKVRRKYLDKFGEAIKEGTIPTGRASLGLCVVKWPELVPLVRGGLRWTDVLWNECTGLGRIEVFHLERTREGRYHPTPLAVMSRPPER